MTSVVMRRRLMAVGLAVCQMALTAPAVYAAEQDVFSETAEEVIVQEEAVEAAVAGGQEDSGAGPQIDSYSVPYALMETSDGVKEIYGDGTEILPQSDEADTFDAANISGSSNGGVFVTINGTYKTVSINTILNKLDDIRLEAAQNSYPNPNSSDSDPLSLSSYGDNLSLKWSTDLEDVACYRAAEQTCIKGIRRANGGKVSSLLPADFTGTDYAESIVFTADGLLKGIDLIKSEKSNYLKAKKEGITSGVGDYSHYAMLINPEYTSVGVGCFKTSADNTCVVVLSLCKGTVKSGSEKSQYAGATTATVEISNDCVNKISASPKSKTIYKGKTYTIPVNVDIKQVKSGDTVLFKTKTGLARDGLDWTVMNGGVATVDHTGLATGLSNGYTKILAYINGTSYNTDFNLTVNGAVDPTTTTVKSTAYIKAPDSPDAAGHAVTTYITYTNAATYTGKAIKRAKLNVDKSKINIGDLNDAYGADLSSAITYTWKYANNKKVFVDENSDTKQPYFYVQMKLNNKKAKKLVGSKNLKLLKAAVKSVNTELKKDRCYFYINPKQ